MNTVTTFKVELETVARERVLQGRLINRKVDELRESWMKSGLAEEMKPALDMLAIISKEEDLKTEILMFLLEKEEGRNDG
ncbi:hypothetical protein ACB087_04090 [Vibrio sp. VNB-15]